MTSKLLIRPLVCLPVSLLAQPLFLFLSSFLNNPVKLSDPPILTPSTPQDSATPSNRTATNRSTALSAFASTFVAIFLAEFGDKTQVAVLLMAAESHEPWVVFVGAATALIATSLVGVLVGRLLARWVSVKTLETIVGAILLMVSTSLLWEAVVGG